MNTTAMHLLASNVVQEWNNRIDNFNFKKGNNMKAFNNQEIEKYLSESLKGWIFENGMIKRDFKFENFVAAFSFITSVAMEAEKMDHHPEWNNVYNQVTIALNTHSAGGITQLDFDLASKIDNLYKKYQ